MIRRYTFTEFEFRFCCCIYFAVVECAGESYVKCNSSARCISVSWLCDGDADCEGGEDELNCPGTGVLCRVLPSCWQDYFRPYTKCTFGRPVSRNVAKKDGRGVHRRTFCRKLVYRNTPNERPPPINAPP